MESSFRIVDSARVKGEDVLISGFLLNLMAAGSHVCFSFIYVAVCIADEVLENSRGV